MVNAFPSCTCQDTSIYRKTTLDNGIRIVTEQVPYIQSVSLGIWVQSGSRFEAPEVNGISHFIEHMLFKGTERRTAYEIAREIDSVGGVLNAFTSKELTSFYCKVIEENLEMAVDLLSDIFLNPSFPDDEIEREKQVICQEIYQVEDSPEDLIHEILGARFWRDNPLGQPVLGTIPSVTQLDRPTVLDFKANAYSPAETVFCAAGKLEHDRIVELCHKIMGGLHPGSDRPVQAAPRVEPSRYVLNRDLEQVHICLATEGPASADERRHAAYLLNAILGGGMSSRLFQEVREKSGLAYSVYSYLSSLSDTGMFGIYAACEPARVDELLDIVKKETENLADSLTEEEISTAKSQIKGNVVLSMESTESRMNRLAKGEFYFGRNISLKEILDSLDEVSPEAIAQLARDLLNSTQPTLVALGPVKETDQLFSMFDNHSDPQ